MRSRRSSDTTLFVRTHVAKYFVSLLICNLVQAIAGLINLAWIAENRVYVGTACTAQAVIKQIGNVRRAVILQMQTQYSPSCHLSVEARFSLS